MRFCHPKARLVIEVEEPYFSDSTVKLDEFVVGVEEVEVRLGEGSLFAHSRRIRYVDSIQSACRTSYGAREEAPALLLFLHPSNEGEPPDAQGR